MMFLSKITIVLLMMFFLLPVRATSNAQEFQWNYKLYLLEATQKYHISFHDAYETINCESGFSPKAVGDGGLAQGIAQYHFEAFERHAKFVGLNNLNYHDPYDQLDLFARAISLGFSAEWTCWPK